MKSIDEMYSSAGGYDDQEKESNGDDKRKRTRTRKQNRIIF